MSDVETYYEQGHTEYKAADLAPYDSRFINVTSAVRKHLSVGSKLLDLGCGDMYFASQLPEYDITGLDLDESKGTGIIKWDLSKAPYPVSARAFDGVICSEVLEHLWVPEVCLGEMARVLRPGGYAFITVPNFDMLDAKMGGHKHLLYNRANTFAVEHIRQYQPGNMNSLVEGAGFTGVMLQGNSPQLSDFFEFARRALADILGVPQLEADAALGKMFPAHLPGFLLVARRNS
jgi:SAM-dependent methyltransferase